MFIFRFCIINIPARHTLAGTPVATVGRDDCPYDNPHRWELPRRRCSSIHLQVTYALINEFTLHPPSLPHSFPQSHNIQACIICDDVRNVVMTVHYAPARPPAENCHFPELFRFALVIFPDVMCSLFALYSHSPNATDFHFFPSLPICPSFLASLSFSFSFSFAENVWAMGPPFLARTISPKRQCPRIQFLCSVYE